MKETLRALVELQSLEDNLRDLRTQQAKLAAIVQENDSSRELFTGMLSAQEAELGEVRTFCGQKEDEIKESEDNARRARGRLSHIQNQRELTALNKELDTARRQNTQRTEELLSLMTQLETATTDYDKKVAEFSSLEEQMAQAEQDILARVREGEADALGQRTRQEELRALVDKPTLSRFDRILANRNGCAVSPVKDQICTACRLAVSPQVLIRLMGMEKLEQCNNCRRFIVWLEGFNDAPESEGTDESDGAADQADA